MWYNLIEDNNLDIIIGGYNEIRDNNIVKVRTCEPGLHIYEGENIVKFFDKLLSSKVNTTNKEIGDAPLWRIYTRLFKRESIGKLRFNSNIHMSEDTLFMIDYIYQVKKIGIIDKVWYNYYINDYSISKGTEKDKLINNINDFIKEIEKRMNEEENEILKRSYQLRIDKSNSYIERIK